jgi:dTDP-glucose 4,6-dehydratase
MKLLITGGAGFIGSNFIRYWLREHPKDQIINLDKLTYAGNLANLKDIEHDERYSFVQGDICDQKIVDQAMQGCDIVVHFAAESHVDRSIKDSAPFIMTNVVGTHVLLESALRHKAKRFHHVSTDEVFGSLDLDSKQKFNEQTRYNPRSPYSASKAASDHLVRSYFYTYDLPATITNTENNYGPYLYPEKLLSLAITNLLENKKVPIYGNGKYVRDWLYVEDHCYGIDLVLQKGRVGETYCIGGLTQDLNNLEVIHKVLKLMDKGDEFIEFVSDRPGHDRRYAVDWSKAQKELGYNPRASFDEYLAKMVQWYKDNEAWWKPLKSN